MTTHVMDACALDAYLRDEAGADTVENLLLESDGARLVHAVNLCEVYYDTLRGAGLAAAEKAVSDISGAGIVVRYDMDDAFWRQIGQLKVSPGKLSLADCFALALSIRVGATLVTSDHEFDLVAALGLCPVLFIR